MMTNNPGNTKVKIIQVLVALGGTIGALAGIITILQFFGITLIKPPQSVAFICRVSGDGVPTTFAQETTNGGIPKSKPMIRWVSGFGSEVGYTPQKRCEEVSNRLQNYSNKGLLNYIKIGKEGNLDTICVAKAYNGPCVGLLLTLKQGTNPQDFFNQLLSDNGLHELEGSNASKIYIDVNKFLRKSPVEENKEPANQVPVNRP